MSIQYQIPDNLSDEIKGISELINEHIAGRLDDHSLKVKRVPFGIYEQREAGSYLIRLRLPGGIVTPPQLSSIARISERLGGKYINITTRQGIQIPDVKIHELGGILSELLEYSVSSRGGGGNTVRNIVWPPESGVDPDEIFDVTEYGLALTSRLVAEPESWNLPRKFKVSFSGNPMRGHVVVHDLGFTAQIRDGQKGFRVTVAGGMGANSELAKVLYDFVEDDKVYFIARAVRSLFDKYGNRKQKHKARLRFLMKKLGETEFGKRFEKEYQAALSRYEPLRLDGAPELIRNDGPVGEKPVDAKEFTLWKTKHASLYREKLYNIEIPIFLGKLDNGFAVKLSELIKDIGNDVLRFNLRQNILLRAVPEDWLREIFNLVYRELPHIRNEGFLDRIVVCTGSYSCKLGVCHSRGLVQSVADTLNNTGENIESLGEVDINISGCPNNCGQHSIGDLGFFGRVGRNEGELYPAYSVLVGAKLYAKNPELAKQLGSIHAKQVPDFIKKVIEEYRKDESGYPSFKAFLQAVEAEKIEAIINSFPEIPSVKENPDFYRDYESSEAFSLIGKGEAECSAGLLDMVNADFQTVTRLENRLKGSVTSSLNLRNIVFHSARALLITQGVEAHSALEVYSGFKKLFTERGIVSPEFNSLLDLAEENNPDELIKNSDRVKSFAQTMRELYDSMDDSLRFHHLPEESHSRAGK
ncbi:MAG: nitrite/sulfite reductase [Spirochaetota bacterium]|nr:nitrite/sulfite reductase [Spirochaetota bacterium]